MTVPNFPPNPANGATVTENGITYTFNDNGGGANIGFWEASGEAINLQSVTDNGNTTTKDITTGNITAPNIPVYATGVWTPGFEGASVSGTYLGSDMRATYTRIGQLCHVNCRTGFANASGGTGAFIIKNLPFDYEGHSGVVGSFQWDNIAWNGSSGSNPFTATVIQLSESDDNRIQIVYSADSVGTTVLNAGQITTSSKIRFSLTYTIAS